MRCGFKTIGSIIVLVVLAQSLLLAAQEPPPAGAKALFYDPASGAALKPKEKRRNPRTGRTLVKKPRSGLSRYVGIQYWLEMENGESVTEGHIFHTGDSIRLRLRSNTSGFLSLWALDASGRGQMIFPTPGSQNNIVEADSEYITPGWIRFKPPAEDERLLVFFSRSKSDIPSPSGNASDAEAGDKALGPVGKKELVFETEKSDSAEIGTYVVNWKGGPVVREIRLKHRL